MSSLPPHLEPGAEARQLQFPVLGIIKAVFPKNHTENNTGGRFTTYQVQAIFQNPPQTVLYAQLRAKGQQSGGLIDWEIPYLLNQKVVVAFLEGDPGRPYIDGKWPDFAEENEVSQDSTDQPQTTVFINGARFVVTKEGDVKITMAQARSVQFLNQNGDVIADVVENGDVKLGGSTGLNRLIDERAQNLIEDHAHYVTVASLGVPALTSEARGSTGLNPLDLSGTLTSKTKAK